MRTFHVTSRANRESIARHGLDPARMAAACGIAGSPTPEIPGVYLCLDEAEAEWFVRINNTGGPVDVWAVDGIDPGSLTEDGSGFAYVVGTIAADRLRLLYLND